MFIQAAGRTRNPWLCCHLPDRPVGCQERRLAGNISQGIVHFPSALTEPMGCPCDLAQQDFGRKSLGSTAALEVKGQERGCHRLFFSPDRIRSHQRIFWSNSEEKYFHKNVLVLPLKTLVALNKQCLLLIQPSGDEVWAQHSATLPS